MGTPHLYEKLISLGFRNYGLPFETQSEADATFVKLKEYLSEIIPTTVDYDYIIVSDTTSQRTVNGVRGFVFDLPEFNDGQIVQSPIYSIKEYVTTSPGTPIHVATSCEGIFLIVGHHKGITDTD